MDFEVKLRLQDSKGHQTLSSILSPFHKETNCQRNLFFDGVASELSSQGTVLFLRFLEEDFEKVKSCRVVFKSKNVIVDGVSRVELDYEGIDPLWGSEIVADPKLFGSVQSRIVRRVSEEFGVNVEERGYVCLGGFLTVREVYEWKGLKVEVDEVHFDFGTLYEVECESAEPDKAKELIEGFLKENGIPYSYSEMSKFAIFQSGMLPMISSD